MLYVLRRLAKEADLPDRIVRSNKRGWKFSSIRPNNVNNGLRNAAIAAVAAMGLDFGAVDCALGQNDAPWVIEINSGPGLQGSSLDAYITAFQNKIAEFERPEPRRAAPAAPAQRGRQRDQRGRFVGVGAAAANPEELAAADVPENRVPVDNAGLARVMQNVRSDDEARAVIDALMRGNL